MAGPASCSATSPTGQRVGPGSSPRPTRPPGSRLTRADAHNDRDNNESELSKLHSLRTTGKAGASAALSTLMWSAAVFEPADPVRSIVAALQIRPHRDRRTRAADGTRTRGESERGTLLLRVCGDQRGIKINDDLAALDRTSAHTCTSAATPRRVARRPRPRLPRTHPQRGLLHPRPTRPAARHHRPSTRTVRACARISSEAGSGSSWRAGYPAAGRPMSPRTSRLRPAGFTCLPT